LIEMRATSVSSTVTMPVNARSAKASPVARSTAMAAATVDDLSGGRFILGIGSSHKVQVEAEHGVAYAKPLTRTRESVAAIRTLLRDGTLHYEGETFRIEGFDLWFAPRRPAIPVYLSAVFPKMTALAGEIADGLIERPAHGVWRVRRDADRDTAGRMLRQPVQFFVVDTLVFFFHAVGREFVHAPRKIQRVPVGQVAAVRQVHAQHRIAGLQCGHVHRDVCRGAGMRLHVGVLGSKQFFGAVDGQLLHFVGILAAAVVTLARIAFGVFVGEDGAHRFEHRFGDEIFRGDQLESGGLPPRFVAQQVGNLRIDNVERPVHALIFIGGRTHDHS